MLINRVLGWHQILGRHTVNGLKILGRHDHFPTNCYKYWVGMCTPVPLTPTGQRRLDPGKETPEGFFQVRSQKEYQNVVMISFVNLEKINIFCFMLKSVAQKLSLPRPLENSMLNGHKSVNFKARDFSFWIQIAEVMCQICCFYS